MLYILLLSAILQQTPDLIRMLEATRQEWTGGREETGKGVDFGIKVVTQKSSAKLKIVSVTVDQTACDFKVMNMSHPEKAGRYRKGDTLMIAALLKNPPEQPRKNEKSYPVIGCFFKGAVFYFPVRAGMAADSNYNK